MNKRVSNNCASFEFEEICWYFIPDSNTAMPVPLPICDSFHALRIDSLWSFVRRGDSVDNIPCTVIPPPKKSDAAFSALPASFTVLVANDNIDFPSMPFCECITKWIMLIGSIKDFVIFGA